MQVRRIEFKGNTGTADEVLRREMRQFEGAWFSQAALDRSKIRLQRLGFFDTVEIETPSVAGRPDEVDVVVNVVERNSGQFTFGLGYQQAYGLITSVQLTQNNFLGTGNRFSTQIQHNSYSKQFALSYTDPYFTDDGVSLGFALNHSDFDYSDRDANMANFNNAVSSGEIFAGIPITETDQINLSLGIDRNQITTDDASTPPVLIDYLVDTMGDRERFPLAHLDDDDDEDTPADNDDDDPTTPDTPVVVPGFSQYRKWNVNAWRLQVGWQRDSRNDYLMPTRGQFHRVGLEVVLPGSDLEYYRLNYDFEHYWLIKPWLGLNTAATIGYGDSYGKTKDQVCSVYDDFGQTIVGETTSCGLPFFRHYYVGGPNSVRGFESNSIGPVYEFNDSYVQSLGGPLKTAGTFELYFPTLFDNRGTRLSAFFDWGNVYRNGAKWEANKLRLSTGLSLQWQSPMGPIAISYAIPLQYERHDQIERLQFTFGGSF